MFALAVLVLPTRAASETFGRFGYDAQPTVPGFTITREGFATNHPAADRLRFNHPMHRWKPAVVSATGQTVLLDDEPGSPSKFRQDLFGLGFSLYFNQGIELKLSSTTAPYLTWTDGSAANGVPTPNVKWLILSFRDAQPPLIFGFPDAPGSLQVTGQAGDWTVKSEPKFRGWVRIGLPVGLTPDAANSAASLGKLAQQAAKQEGTWTTMPPVLRRVAVESDEDSVTATWSFDHPGAVVPQAASLASLGGYPIRIMSNVARLNYPLDLGPTEICQSNELRVRFPIRRIPAGRGLAIGGELGAPNGTVSPIDVPSVVELALETLTSTRDDQTRHLGETTVAEYLSQAAYSKEPSTDQLLPYDAAGNGIDVAAAEALLMQSLASSAQTTSEGNSLLTSVLWRQDWSTWMPWIVDPGLRRRTAALAAIAGAICPEPERRLTAGMLQAGLSAERGLQIWRRRQSGAAEAPLRETMFGLRQGIFRLQGNAPDPSASFVDSMVSPLRVYGNLPIRLDEQEKALTLEWMALEPKPGVLNFASSFDLVLTPVANLPRFVAHGQLGSTEVLYTPETTGLCDVKLTLPAWMRPLPKASPTPRFSEVEK